MKINVFAPIVLAVLLTAVSAIAHPLGNFSVNQFAKLEVASSQLKTRQVLELAEIPTITELRIIDANADGQYTDEELKTYVAGLSSTYLSNIAITIEGQAVSFEIVNSKAELREGSGGLSILHIGWDLTSTLPGGTTAGKITYSNKNYSDRIGWNEIFVTPTAGTTVFDSNVFGNAVTDELKVYPDDSLTSALAERNATFSFTRLSPPADAKLLQTRDGKPLVVAKKDTFAALIDVPEITPWIAFVGLLAAFGLGAMHAMSPGHGKTVVGAYLVGSNGTAKHAAFLGLTVTITHTLGVFALGLITLFASNYILPERLIPILSFISGLLVLYIGLTMFKSRLLAALGVKADGGHHDHGNNDHGDGHTHDNGEHSHDEHTHSHGGAEHSHMPPAVISWKSLAALGISGGLLPCPSALVLMLAAITVNRVGYGLLLTLVFSFGLAATLTAFGFAFLYLGRIFDRPSLANNRIIKALPVFSAFVITCLGALLCYNSFTS